MAEEEVFDPTLKKKKKKKKTPFELDGTGEKPEASEAVEAEDEDLDMDLSKKKKKKKKVVLDDDDEDNEVAAVEEDIDLENFGKKKKKKKKEALDLDDLGDALPDDNADDDLDLESFGKKKKKKKRGDLNLGEDESSENKENEESNPWMNSDRDYTYDELLARAFSIIRDKNPEMEAGKPKTFVMRPPQVMKVGAKKTAFVNFNEIAKMLHRQPKHLLAFLFAELGTVGAIDGSNQLIIKGRFQQKHIENILRRYIKEYVMCHTCRSPDTILVKEGRIFFLQCMTCHSKCSVQTIKTGFQAVTSKRSAQKK